MESTPTRNGKKAENGGSALKNSQWDQDYLRGQFAANVMKKQSFPDEEWKKKHFVEINNPVSIGNDVAANLAFWN